MDPTRRFTNRVDNYRRFRPDYPPAVAQLIRQTCGPAATLTVADLGSGTGIFTRKLLEAGFTVSAVEPNEAMREVAETALRQFSGFESIAAPAEQTGLPDHNFDAITAAQAFHWFKREEVRREFQRILKPNGWVFLIWNERNQPGSAFNQAYEDLLSTLGEAYQSVRNRWGGQGLDDFFTPGTYQTAHFDNAQRMTREELKGHFISSSYVPTEADPRHQPLLAKLEEIFRRYELDGYVEFEQQANVYFGQV